MSWKSSPSRVVIVDYRTGNLNSIKRVLDRIRACPVISSQPRDIAEADKIILPGVGHFGKTMSNLKELGLIEALNEAALHRQKPILGICLGMELMAEEGEEGSASGLGWLRARAVRFRISDTSRYKVPHMGWNGISIKKSSELMKGVEASSEFYFAHSFHLEITDDTDALSETEYGIPFVSAVQRGNIFGVQYHPEKSHDVGIRVLKNFIEI